jgi:hypothetical protein
LDGASPIVEPQPQLHPAALKGGKGHACPDATGRPAEGTLIHISIAIPLFSELRRVGSVERGKKCTTKGKKIR